MSSTGINFSGLASGIDSNSIITQLTQVAQKPITLLQGKDDNFNAQLATWQGFNTQLAALQTAADALNQPSTYSTASATSSNSAVASITTLPGAELGDHALTVTQLAQAQKVVSAAVSSGSTALGQTGSFTLNGKTVQINSTDALTDVAVKINAAKAGVTAAVVNVGPNDFRITLTSAQTGAAGAIAAADSGGSILSGLGILQAGGAAGVRQSVSYTQNNTAYAGAASLTLKSATQTVGALLGIAAGSAPAGAFHLSNGGTGTGNEADIAVDLNSASLTDIANAINKAGIGGVSAEVVTVPDANGNLNRIHQLHIVGSGGATPSFTDGSNILATIGVLQNQYAKTITVAKDAQFNMDGLDLTRSSNSLNDVIPGATIKLLSGTAAAPGTTTLSVSQNTDSIVTAVKTFATAYNAIQDFVAGQNKFTPPTDTKSGVSGTSAALFGNTTLTQIQDQLSQTLTAVSGKTTLETIGLTVDTQGHLNVDDAALTQSLQSDPNVVSGLFSLSGASDSGGVQFLTAGPKTAATSGAGYAVNITQAATQSTGTAGVAFAATPGNKSAAPETLTFGGSLFSSGARLTLPTGSSLQDTVNLINDTSSLNTQIYARIDSGNHLVIASQKYGSGTGFTVSSDLAADGTNSGIGGGMSVTAGVPVAGTINGEAATGIGQTLTGNAGNAHTEGIQLLVTAPAATGSGTPGHITITHGVADGLSRALTQILDPGNGSVIGAENSLNSQISDTQQQIQKIQDQISSYKDYLTQMFSDMETRVSALQSQGNAFMAAIGNSSTTSSAGNSKK